MRILRILLINSLIFISSSISVYASDSLLLSNIDKVLVGVESYYIDSYTREELTLLMISGLQAIDDNIKVSKSDKDIVISYRDELINRYKVPYDKSLWNVKIFEIIRDIRCKVNLSADDIFVKLTDTMLSRLDNYSYYHIKDKSGEQDDRKTLDYKEVKSGYLYIKFIEFYDGLSEDITRVINNSGAIKGLVIDLRGNKGGNLLEAVRVSDLFLDRGAIVRVEGRHRKSQQEYDASFGDIARNTPIMIVIDNATVSSAELFAMALGDNGRAIVVGGRSYGKDCIQKSIPLSNGDEIYITWARFISPSGRKIEGIGIYPDRVIEELY